MEDWKNLLKWQFVIPAIIFVFTCYGSYINLKNNMNLINKQVLQNEQSIQEIKDNTLTRLNKQELDVAIIKQDQSFIKDSQNTIIRKLDDFTYKKN